MKSKRFFYVLLVLLSLTNVIANQPTGATLTLLEAAKNGDLDQITKLIETTDDINATDEHGRTALHYAAMIGREDIVKILVTRGAEINLKNDYGITPLTEAIDGAYPIEAGTNHDQVIKLLVANGADVNAKGEFDMTALHWAAHTGQSDFVEKLIAKGAEINAKNMEGWTPLQEACYDGNLDIAKLLIVNGGNINSKDELDLTPLHRATLFGHKEIVKLLVVNGADIHSLDKDSETPLHLAAQHGQKAMVEFLIAKGADVNAKNRYGVTPLGLAVGGFRTMARLPKVLYSKDYCERGDYFYYQDELDRALEDYTSALRLNSKNDKAYFLRGRAWAQKKEPQQAIADWKRAIELDWNNALQIHYTRRLLKTPYMELDRLIKETAMEHLKDVGIVSGYAVGYSGSPGDFYTISLIISEPFEEKIFMQFVQSDNPVIRAMGMICLARKDKLKYERQVHSFYKDTAEVKYVPMGCVISTITLDNLARKITEDPNELDCWSAAHNDWKFKESERDSQREDAMERQVEVIRILISESADINVTDRLGETPLHYAAEHGNTYVTECLITNGADVNAKNNNGDTPLHCSTFWGYQDMIELLMASGADITAKNSKGQTAVDIATQQDYPGLSTLLRSFEKK